MIKQQLNSKSSLKELLSDHFYVFNNLEKLNEKNIKLKDFPEEIQKNILFIQKYFSTISTNVKEYSYIPEQLLKNEFFLYSCLEKNPDIYLLVDKKFQKNNVFLKIKEMHKESYLKYASSEQLLDINFCKQALKDSYKNYQFLPENLKLDQKICFDIVKEFYDFDIKNKEYFAKILPKSLKSDRDFVKKLLYNSPHYYLGLPKEYLSDKEMAYIAIDQDTALFKHVDITLKNDKEFVFEILENITKRKSNPFKSFANLRNYISEIIQFLPINYFNEEFCEKYKEEIAEVYTKLSKEHRSDINIIKAVYSIDSFNPEMFKKSFLNKIPDEELRNKLYNFIKTFQHKEQAHFKVGEFLNIFKLKFNLETELSQKNINKVKNKI